MENGTTCWLRGAFEPEPPSDFGCFATGPYRRPFHLSRESHRQGAAAPGLPAKMACISSAAGGGSNWPDIALLHLHQEHAAPGRVPVFGHNSSNHDVCALATPGKGPCREDSGSPLFIKTRGKLGVVTSRAGDRPTSYRLAVAVLPP
jgi:hypothetical protein